MSINQYIQIVGVVQEKPIFMKKNSAVCCLFRVIDPYSNEEYIVVEPGKHAKVTKKYLSKGMLCDVHGNLKDISSVVKGKNLSGKCILAKYVRNHGFENKRGYSLEEDLFRD